MQIKEIDNNFKHNTNIRIGSIQILNLQKKKMKI